MNPPSLQWHNPHLETPMTGATNILLPCPFCGGRPDGPTQLTESVWEVQCNSQLRHDAHAMSWKSSEDAIATWNRRAPQQAGGEDVEFEFQVWQDDAMQAGGSGPTLASVETEATHYALMYGQDGPVELRYYERRRLSDAEIAAEAAK